MKSVTLSVELINELANYIASRPLGEVLPLFEKLKKEIEAQAPVGDQSVPTVEAEEV